MQNPGRSWGDASQWYAALGGNNTPAVGSIAWFGSADHVAYVDAVNGSQVHILADNFPGSASKNGYTDSGWIAASSVSKFLHPHDVVGGGAGGGGYEMAFQANTGALWSVGPADMHGAWGFGMANGTSPSITP